MTGILDAKETKDTSTQGPLKKAEAHSSCGMGLGREAKQLLGLPGLCLQAVVSSVCQVPQLMTGRSKDLQASYFFCHSTTLPSLAPVSGLLVKAHWSPFAPLLTAYQVAPASLVEHTNQCQSHI